MSGSREFYERRAQFREAILYDDGLTFAARVVGYHIATLINWRTGDAWPAQKTLCEDIGITTRTIRACVDQLVARGWFAVKPDDDDGRSFRYVPDEQRWRDSQTSRGGRAPEAANRRANSGKNFRQIAEKTSPYIRYENQESKIISADDAERLDGLAIKQGAPRFVFEGSVPWQAWCHYRNINGTVGAMPTRQKLVRGRLRTGWDAPTLYPPGYSPQHPTGRGNYAVARPADELTQTEAEAMARLRARMSANPVRLSTSTSAG